MKLTSYLLKVGLKCPAEMWLKARENKNLKINFNVKEYFNLIQATNVENFNHAKLLYLQKKNLKNVVLESDKYKVNIDYITRDKEEITLHLIKQSTKLKKEYIEEINFCTHIARNLGFEISEQKIHYIDNQKTDINDFWQNESVEIKNNEYLYENLYEHLNSENLPETSIIKNCQNKIGCENKKCYEFLDEHNIFTLHKGHYKIKEYIKNGTLSIVNLSNLEGKQEIQKQSILKNKVHLNKNDLSGFLEKINYPISFIDFETYSLPIPKHEEKPYTKFAFQYSLHVLDEKGKLTHKEYLHENQEENPHKKVQENLMKDLPEKGTIIAFNAPFEKSIFKKLNLDEHIGRFIDLATPFNNFWYYNPKQKGKTSIKVLLPLLTDLNYNNLEINNGQLASESYFEKKYLELKDYCKLDTLAMVKIYEKLKELSFV